MGKGESRGVHNVTNGEKRDKWIEARTKARITVAEDR